MIMKYLCLLSLILLCSCGENFLGNCDASESKTFEYHLEDIDTLAFKYQLDQTIPFKHSNGYEFDFSVITRRIVTNEQDRFFEECCDGPKVFYDTHHTVLNSVYPDLRVEIIAYSTKENELFHGPHLNYSLLINYRYSFMITVNAEGALDTDVLGEFIDTLHVFDRKYCEVVKYTLNSSNNSQYSNVRPENIYIADKKIIKIEMKNGDYYGINE